MMKLAVFFQSLLCVNTRLGLVLFGPIWESMEKTRHEYPTAGPHPLVWTKDQRRKVKIYTPERLGCGQ